VYHRGASKARITILKENGRTTGPAVGREVASPKVGSRVSGSKHGELFTILSFHILDN